MKQKLHIGILILIVVFIAACSSKDYSQEDSVVPTTLPARITEIPSTDLDSDINKIADLNRDLTFGHLDRLVNDLLIEI